MSVRHTTFYCSVAMTTVTSRCLYFKFIIKYICLITDFSKRSSSQQQVQQLKSIWSNEMPLLQKKKKKKHEEFAISTSSVGYKKCQI